MNKQAKYIKTLTIQYISVYVSFSRNYDFTQQILPLSLILGTINQEVVGNEILKYSVTK